MFKPESLQDNVAPLGKRRDVSSDNAEFTLGRPQIQTMSNFLSGLITLLIWDLGLRASQKERGLFAFELMMSTLDKT